MQTNTLFLQMIQLLREEEAVVLYGFALEIDDQEAEQVVEYLKSSFEVERLAYPYQVPEFDPEAALWAAKLVYFACQFLLYRETADRDLKHYFFHFPKERTPAAMLSADLTLRILPDLMDELRDIDSQDNLVSLLEEIVACWPYSAVRSLLAPESMEFDVLVASSCLHQLTMDRIIENKKMNWAARPEFYNEIKAGLGWYIPQFWKEFNLIQLDEQQR